MVHVPVPPPTARRGGAVRALLVLASLAAVAGSVAGLFTVATGQEDDTLGPSPLPRRVLILAVCGVINVGFAAGVWGYRRWGVYGIVCVSLFAFILNWRIGGAGVAVPGVAAVAVLIGVAAMSWAELD